jgi:4-methyl-5(b-hydroxyethyl)-thiazole monophosphate biosynthesis
MRACVLLAPGFEETEAVTIIDVLRRAEVDTTVIGVAGESVEGSHQIVILADVSLADASGESFDLIVLPGGMPGSERLRDDDRVQAFIRRHHEGGARLAAICAAPIALAKAGVLEGRRATSYPGFADQLPGAAYEVESVVVDGPVVTSRGVGTALEFSLELVAQLKGSSISDTLADRMLTSRRSRGSSR